MIDRLPIVQPGGWNCPAQFAGSPRVQFVLRSAGGAVLARAAEDADVVEPTTPCDPLSFSVGGHPETALLHGASFLHAVARLPRARLAVGRPVTSESARRAASSAWASACCGRPGACLYGVVLEGGSRFFGHHGQQGHYPDCLTPTHFVACVSAVGLSD